MTQPESSSLPKNAPVCGSMPRGGCYHLASRGEQICALVDQRAVWRERALAAEARVAAVKALHPKVLCNWPNDWRCGVCCDGDGASLPWPCGTVLAALAGAETEGGE